MHTGVVARRTVHLPDVLDAQLVARAVSVDRSVSWVVGRALEGFLSSSFPAAPDEGQALESAPAGLGSGDTHPWGATVSGGSGSVKEVRAAEQSVPSRAPGTQLGEGSAVVGGTERGGTGQARRKPPLPAGVQRGVPQRYRCPERGCTVGAFSPDATCRDHGVLLVLDETF